VKPFDRLYEQDIVEVVGRQGNQERFDAASIALHFLHFQAYF
jgi:hypothetical protein